MLVFNFIDTYIKIFLKFYGFQICAYFPSGLVALKLLAIFVIFRKIKVAKHIWNPCCHLTTETYSWFIQFSKFHPNKTKVVDWLRISLNFYYITDRDIKETTVTIKLVKWLYFSMYKNLLLKCCLFHKLMVT